ncbi:MAG TPA: homoserine dehydrogenase [Caulobacteraceae bacterium]|jgi:homoserine dehydrogenase|nr:homoserine dehydrogenase [Caulobacteraceae bacterium]
MTERTWRVGVAGLGTVGAGFVRLLQEAPHFAPAGGRAEIAGVSARRRNAAREADVSGLAWFDDPVALARDPGNDIFVELIGGSEGVARAAVEAALAAGKPVVTANKALVACHGAELAALAESKGVPLLFEAAVMGGTPAVKFVREALVGDEIGAVAGILNGTSNFILSQMEATGRGFAEVLAEAQRLGYAEADPTTDIGGFDAAHKIAILAALAFDCAPTLEAVEIEGIEDVSLLDIRLARDLGYRIKQLAMATRTPSGAWVRVHPALLPLDHPLARADGALNALFIEGRRIGRMFIQGAGAGAGPTATAVAADIADVMAASRRPVFQKPASRLTAHVPATAHGALEKAYVRLIVRDEPGVIAAVSETLAEAGVSIDSFLQKHVDDGPGVPMVLTTHPAPSSAITAAMERIGHLPALIAPPRRMPVARI